MTDYEKARASLATMIQELGVTMTSTAINEREGLKGLGDGWRLQACHARCQIDFAGGGRYSTEYSAGLGAAFGHLSFEQFMKLIGIGWDSLSGVKDAYAQIKGRECRLVFAEPILAVARMKWAPNIVDVIARLVIDATDAPFEGFCADFGYNTDSRKAEAVWLACCETGRVMRRNIGNEKLEELRELAIQL